MKKIKNNYNKKDSKIKSEFDILKVVVDRGINKF